MIRRANRWMWALAILIGLAGCGVPCADGPANTYGLDFSGLESADGPAAMVFFVDGLNAAVFDEMLAAGELPAIQTYFLDRGLYCPRTVANIPSITLVNQTSFVTGLYPGHHGITSNNWFDRNQLIWRNYDTIAQKNTLDGDYAATTIYEALPDRTTMSVFFQAHRGATQFVENRLSAVGPYAFGWYEFVDRLTLSRMTFWADLARRRGDLPAATIVYQIAPDFRAYGFGASSPDYRQAIRHADRQIGRVLGDLEAAGVLDRLHLALVSDHGIGDVTDHFDLKRFLRDELGIDVASEQLAEETPFEKRLATYQRRTAVVYGAGDRHRAIHLRKPIGEEGDVVGQEAWPKRPNAEDLTAYPTPAGPVDLPTVLAGLGAVDAVAYPIAPDRVRLVFADGEVEFHQPAGRGGAISYRAVRGDPLGWDGAVPADLLDGQPHPIRQWLAATIDTDFPGLPAGLIAYFRARRAGDLAVFAAKDWDFGDHLRAGHGGLRADEMLTPLLLAGPGVPVGRLDVAQAVDVMPTLLTLLGADIPADLDGQALITAPTD